MLKFITPNGEEAILLNPHSSLDGATVHVDAISNDFAAEADISRPYATKVIRDYFVYYLYRPNMSDSNIFDFVDKMSDERIGLIAPIRSLSSRDHIKANDEYFEIVASSVFWDLLEDRQGTSTPIPATETPSISDFYDENLAILVVNQLTNPSFNINRYLPSLFSYGYSIYDPQRTQFSQWDFSALPTGRQLKVVPVNEAYLDDGYIQGLYSELLPYEANALAQFMLQYQVCELLMHVVFMSKIDEVKLAVGEFSGTASDLREVLEKVSKVSRERDRIKSAIDSKNILTSDVGSLVSACQRLLTGAGKTYDSSHSGDLLYDVRNLVFHNYRAIPAECRDILRDINNYLMRLMPKLLAAD